MWYIQLAPRHTEEYVQVKSLKNRAGGRCPVFRAARVVCRMLFLEYSVSVCDSATRMYAIGRATCDGEARKPRRRASRISWRRGVAAREIPCLLFYFLREETRNITSNMTPHLRSVTSPRTYVHLARRRLTKLSEKWQSSKLKQPQEPEPRCPPLQYAFKRAL